ncbi:hypothetical protein OR16_41254, partial [Cupriavidus basilensis OR16]
MVAEVIHDPAGLPTSEAARQAILARSAALGLSLAQAQRFAAALDGTDPHALLRVLGLDLSMLKPLRPRHWLWMAAQTSSVSYRDTLTPDAPLGALDDRKRQFRH